MATFAFYKPEGYTYRAAQWLRLTLDTSEGPETKTFTQASAPADPVLEITTRLSGSPFKNALAALKPGDPVTFSGPGGTLEIAEGLQRVAFLVGGSGVTPARSMLRDAYLAGRTFEDALVVYGLRDETCSPYLEEFRTMSGTGVRAVPVLEHSTGSWEGETGFITAELLRRYLDPADGRPYFVSGPPAMLWAMEDVLDELGIAEERRIIERMGGPKRPDPAAPPA